jgi:peptidoglycan/xylan/chitin deacetylase (PgdA/CDA1 family)
MKVGLTVDLSGSASELSELCRLLKKYGVTATFFVSGRVCRRELLAPLMNERHEIANHTYTHPADLMQLPIELQREEILKAHEAIVRICGQHSKIIHPRGFRSPYYVFHESILGVLSELGYCWDSSKAFFPALGKPFRAETYGTIIEIPSLFPDDSVLLNKLHLEPENVKNLWIDAFRSSKEYFVWGVHPYVIARDAERLSLLDAFLCYILDSQAEFMSLSDIAGSLATAYVAQ